MKARLLVAEDDASIRLGLIATLESEGYDVVAAADGEQALKLYPQGRYDAVLLDIMMPRRSGYDVCAELRRRDARLPILFLTAKGEEVDKVVGLRLGADDYVTKPFGVHELLARVEALLRRSRASAPGLGEGGHSSAGRGHASSPSAGGRGDDDSLPAVFAFGTAEIDRRRFTARLPDREPVALTARELRLLEVFAAHPDEVLGRDALLNAVWGVDYYGTTRTLDQHILQLRKKVEPHPEAPATLLTVHGVGYRFAPGPARS